MPASPAFHRSRWRLALLAYLVLGNGFDPLDLLAYGVGIALGVMVDGLWQRRQGWLKR
ncbi:hypothetical protein [Comamonas composti]|uniref:hypothetical protein n=1 Tax=Comamonas composti TaxID=408558 RepID=UPI001B7FCC20|nr:hypothetical protein [Comamonas composti]